MIDLHTHVLPGVDDGARSFDEAVAMCRAAAADGVEALVATPHQRHPMWWNDDADRLNRLCGELQALVGPSPRIYLGGEIRCDTEILAAVDRLAEGRGLCRLADSRYLLLEFDSQNLGVNPRAIVHELVIAGWTPIIAHPECLPWLAADLDQAEDLVERGALLQITGASVTGAFGRSPRDCAQSLLDLDLVHFVASDCHRLDFRPPDLAACAAVLAQGWGEERAWRVTVANPRAVLENRPLLAVA